jgi:TM2 domain-containing membrane protein YozV
MTYREEGDMATLSPSKKHCYACASILDVRAELCPKCGVRQPALPGSTPATAALAAPVASSTTKSKISAALLALFLGGIGIHKFYLGQTAAGVLYMLFCWTLIPALIAFIEALVLFGMNETAFARKYPA